MKGIIAAGGEGTRLAPLTTATNKHLLSVYDKPVIYYGIHTLVEAGIDEILIVTNPHHINDYVKLLGSGKDFISINTGHQIQIVYAIQNEPLGIGHNLAMARGFIGNDSCLFHLGDNIFMDNIKPYVDTFNGGARVFLKEVQDPERFGVAEINESGKILSIEEKPKKPKTNYAVTGLYMYDNSVVQKTIGQHKSDRGEYEITSINNLYVKEGTLEGVFLEKEWFDTGTFDSLLYASIFIRNLKNSKDKK
ncbi:NTP transferase domain-containing protein [Candidatus Kaiserbacteria bacterium]|nr:NTP transferase domain-containing protein [Candidatus Kaiserbacteria bacterium]